MPIYSHPGKHLVNHLTEVAQTSTKLVSRWATASNDFIPKEISIGLAYICGAFHDIGKATVFFQEYLLDPEHKVNGPKNHALISAFFAACVAEKFLEKSSLIELEKKVLKGMVFTSVKRHHGKMDNFSDEMFELEEKSKELKVQSKNFHAETATIVDQLMEGSPVKLPWKEFIKYIQADEYSSDYESFGIEFDEDFKSLPKQRKLSFFYFHQLLYSSLLCADKGDVIVSLVDKADKTNNFSLELDHYRKKKNFEDAKSELDHFKNEAYHLSIQHLRAIYSHQQRIYSITLPTGMGKTILSFALAAEMAKLIGEKETRIVVAIPFTSIIDQNFNVFSDILGQPSSDVLLKHHHLAEPLYKNNEMILDAEKSKFLIESWESSVVVTTFVQLLECLFTNDKSKLLKLPQLAGSIILLDEIQTIPYSLWPLIKSSFNALAMHYDCRFIFMSATQPLIFEPEKEIKELVPDYKKYFRLFNRTVLHIQPEIYNLDRFVDWVVEYAYNNAEKNILIILNTKKVCLDVFEKLDGVLNAEDAEMFLLTTLITPYERKAIIAKLKETKNGRRKIVVSTQLVEAGVDISVHTVFRAIAPLDAIVQAAGRANRYGELGIGDVFLFEMEELKRGTNMVYGADLMLKTKNILKDAVDIPESQFLDYIEKYFKEVKLQADNVSNDSLQELMQLEFKNLGKFEFIEERKTESAFIQVNDEARELWERFVEIQDYEDLSNSDKKGQFGRFKSRFYDYVINIPVPYGKAFIDWDGEAVHFFYLSELDSPSGHYTYDPNDSRKCKGYAGGSSAMVF